MSNGFLSQEEIDSLLNGGPSSNEQPVNEEKPKQDLLTDIEKDLLGEIGNISMGSASTALSQVTNQPVNITTPVVSITNFRELSKNFEVPNIVLEVKYVSGITGKNILVMKSTDAAVIASLMMGGDGKPMTTELSEIEISAVQEAMNQMIGSAATSMATMFAREVNISPPVSQTWTEDTIPESQDIGEDEELVQVSFSLTIGTLVDSSIMQLLPVQTAKKIVSIMMGEEEKEEAAVAKAAPTPAPAPQTQRAEVNNSPQPTNYDFTSKPIEEPKRQPVNVNEVSFEPLPTNQPVMRPAPDNIDLILDVPLEISVVLGRTKKSIKDILALGNGSLIELDRLADEPVEILINGKKIANGEVVVVDENFGVRVTSVISGEERIRSLR
ncbi:flagellar motor switch phosphatase FliY [Inconstantimicrobium mannanitabidum]|uniref:Flagellar motor switch phosphatase FliY n=1 Tax=Inconstantimicrobium mannanitabidum TaxID=1604901 RepID=A0ACB5R8U9_9CLOT|nr:flagellar motor switch phosphatase FliY [Clostridium sp. TW13]GKX65456.1 flagellar motor switch phosphatase FliY [Clostridium sp. TW13]